jgi:solute carrier family 45, member 1/2/4
VQFCAWIGFFPLLFYTSSYVGDIYVEPYLERNPHMSPEELDRLYEKATRVGTFALLVFAIVSLLTNVLLPFFIAPTYNGPVTSPATAAASANHQDRESQGKSLLDYLVIPGFTLRWAWLLSNLLFAGVMFCADIARSVKAATVLIGLTGITWGLTLWAPWAIISAEISRRDATLRAWKQSRRSYPGVRDQASDGAGETLVDHEGEDEVDRAGIILGIHNMAIAAPQMLSTLGSSILFRIFQKPRGTPGDHSIGIVFACGGVFVLISAYFIYLIRDDLSSDPVGEEGLLAAAEEGGGEASSVAAGTRAARRKSSSASATQRRSEHARSGSFGTGLEY